MRSVAILENEILEAMLLEIEDLGSRAVARTYRGVVKIVECRRVRLSKISEAEVDQAVPRLLGCTGEDVVCAIDFDGGRILDSANAVTIILGADECGGRASFEAAKQTSPGHQGGAVGRHHGLAIRWQLQYKPLLRLGWRIEHL